MIEDMWVGMGRPHEGRIEAKRVDKNLRNEFFWTRHSDGRYGLSLFHTATFPSDLKLPRMRGLELRRTESPRGHRGVHWILADLASLEPFGQLCWDIIAASGNVSDEDTAIRAAVNRTWRWHRLLRAGGDGPLNPEEQKGLIAELSVLGILVEEGFLQSVEQWRGPLAEPIDFLLDEIGIEVKAPRGTDRDQLHISSEDQLDSSAHSALFLVVCPVERPTEAGPDSRDLRELAKETVALIGERLPTDLPLLEGRLVAAGVNWEHDYSEHRWDVRPAKVFEVRADFPALSRADLPNGVHSVKYRLALATLATWSIPVETFLSHLRRISARGD